MENNEVINHIIEEILNSDELTEKLKSLNNLDEIYSFYRSIDERLSEEDFNDYLSDLIPPIENSKTLDEHLLNQVAGGVKTKKFDKTLAAILSSLALASPMSSNALTSEKTKPTNTTSTQEKFSTKKKLGIAAIGIPTVGALLLGTGKLISKQNTVVVIGGDEKSRDTIVNDLIKNNEDNSCTDISARLAKRVGFWRSKPFNWNIKKINTNDLDSDDSDDSDSEKLLKNAMMAIVIVRNEEEVKEMGEKIDRITGPKDTKSDCMVVCVVDKSSSSAVKEQIDKKREVYRNLGYKGKKLERIAHEFSLVSFLGESRLGNDLCIIWDKDKNKYYWERWQKIKI